MKEAWPLQSVIVKMGLVPVIFLECRRGLCAVHPIGDGSSVYQFRCGWVCPLCLSSSEGVVSGHQSSVPVSHIKGSIASVLVKEA